MELYGLIGYPLSHSFSKTYFEEKFRLGMIHASYANFAIENIQLLPQIIAENPNLIGLNVTIPYKESVLPFLHELSDDAKVIGAVNCISQRENKWIGHNTDFSGFRQLIEGIKGISSKQALIFGDGGASKAVQYALTLLHIPFQIITRNAGLTYAKCSSEEFRDSEIWINTTPVGMFPHINEALSLPFDCLTKEHVVIDLIYNPAETVLLKHALRCGALAINGYDMLVYQAENAWIIWNNNK